MVFGSDAPSALVSCWLSRFWGPQAEKDVSALVQVELATGGAPVALLSDLVVKSGQRVVLIGNGITLKLGERQVRVQPGATLDLQQITIADSIGSPALFVQGKLTASRSILRKCSTAMNALSKNGLESCGGAVYLMGGEANLIDTQVVENSAMFGTIASEGGGIFATM